MIGGRHAGLRKQVPCEHPGRAGDEVGKDGDPEELVKQGGSCVDRARVW